MLLNIFVHTNGPTAKFATSRIAEQKMTEVVLTKDDAECP